MRSFDEVREDVLDDFDDLDNFRTPAETTAGSGEEGEDEDELDECCFYRDPSSMGYAETLQTWRVVREDTDAGAGAGCRLEPLTHAAGKELHRALVSTFDGRNPPLTGALLDLLVCYTSKVVLTPVASMCRERRAIPLNVLGPAGTMPMSIVERTCYAFM